MRSEIVQINAVKGEPLLPDGLSDVLWVLEPQRNHLVFSILLLEGVLKDTTPITYSELQARIKASDHGLSTTWDDLVALNQELVDVSDFLMVGCSKDRASPVKSSFEELAKEVEVVIEVFDSTSLRLFFADATLSGRAQIKFPQAKRSHLA